MPTPPMCAKHEAFIFPKGSTVVLGKLGGLFEVQWQRIRDDISGARVKLVPQDCCDLMLTVGCVTHELHIYRDGVSVWQGPITRIEYEEDQIEVFAEDILWVAKRRVMEVGYDYLYGTGKPGAQDVLNHVEWLLGPQCFDGYGDEWGMSGNLFKVANLAPPTISRAINAWSQTVWEDLDYIAAYFGVDYTVVNRSVFWFDTHYDWNPLADLNEAWLSKFPRIVEYGNRFATRYIKTNGSGYGAVAEAGPSVVAAYGGVIDVVGNDVEQTAHEFDLPLPIPEAPTVEELEQWTETAQNRVDDMSPPPTSIVIPSDTTLLPSTTWDVNTLMAGSWFYAVVDRGCRQVAEYQKVNEMKVFEDGKAGEKISIAAQSAPTRRLLE